MRLITCLTISLLCVGCSDTTQSTSYTFLSKRFKVSLARATDVVDWVAVSGTQEWYFFAAGTFRQDSYLYVEPQFYRDSMACSEVASGTFSNNQETTNDYNGLYTVELTYNGVRSLTSDEVASGGAGGNASAAPGTSTTTSTPAATSAISNLCRTASRELKVIIQDNSTIDVIDGKLMQRMILVETIK